jgi:hypothetical protein
MPTWVPSLLAAVLLLLGSGGLMALLRFQRQETGKTLAHYQMILTDGLGAMQRIVAEATDGFDRIKGERDGLVEELRACRSELRGLRSDLRRQGGQPADDDH